MEKLELIRLQREKQRQEMEEIEREKERVRQAKQRLLQVPARKTRTGRFGNTIAEKVVEEIRQKEMIDEFPHGSFPQARTRSKSIHPLLPFSRHRSPERKEGRYSHKPNFNWEDDDDDDYSPPRNSRYKKSRRSGYSSSVRSPEIFKGDGSLHRSTRDRDHLHPASKSSSDYSLGHSSGSYGGRKDGRKDAVEEFLGEIGAKAGM